MRVDKGSEINEERGVDRDDSKGREIEEHG